MKIPLLGTLVIAISSSSMAMESCGTNEKSEYLVSRADAHKAILSMAGSFNVNFYFKEVFSSNQSYELKNEVQTRGKDIVTPIFISENKISLQHLLITPNGQIIKHWRQDWEYEPKQTFEYIGGYSWKKVRLDDSTVKCKWVQTVWNSDDSPRYSSLGEWSTKTGFISWSSELTLKPLPRREYSKRNDYNTMKSINKHTITNSGWIHEEDNWKYKSNEKSPFIKEIGLNTYTRINDDNFEKDKVEKYLNKYGVFWSYIRSAWDASLIGNKLISLTPPEDSSKSNKPPHYIYIMNKVEEYKGDKSEKVLIKESHRVVNSILKEGEI